ncbi:hypothetical protein [Bifidobacterium scaligerum]|uniref:hypothetical protein n=1 Tax=Bifidobacterium scaligerum TaxID=2052656 RepID=UPI0010561736|nr:hypothetical protein [Bifidobacterium scaligerum]
MTKSLVQLPEPWEDAPWSDGGVPHELNELRFIDEKLFDNWTGGARISTWHRMRNKSTGVYVIIRLSSNVSRDSHGGVAVPAGSPDVILFWSENRFSSISGTDLRDLPLSSICAAYSFNDTRISLNRSSLLCDASVPDKYRLDGVRPYLSPDNIRGFNVLAPLPSRYSRRPWFYSLVGLQFDALYDLKSSENVVDLMVGINHPTAKSTVQGWITRARKMGLLAPAKRVR